MVRGGLIPADTRTPATSMWRRAPARGASHRIFSAAAAGRKCRSPAWQGRARSHPCPLTVAERLRHLRQLVGNALHDLWTDSRAVAYAGSFSYDDWRGNLIVSVSYR